MPFERWTPAVVLSAAIATGCADSHPSAKVADTAGATTLQPAGTLSVSTLRVSGWHDEQFHYLPALSVTAASTGGAVVIQRVDFTAEDAGTRRLLKGVQFSGTPPLQPGRSVDLVPGDDLIDRAEITSPAALASIAATVFFTDDQGQSGLISTAAAVPVIPDRMPVAALVVRRFTIERRAQGGAFSYRPELTLAETSGRSGASIRKIAFEFLDVGSAGQIRPLWNVADVSSGQTIVLAAGPDRPQWSEIGSRADASRMSVTISFVDDDGRGGVVSAFAAVAR